MIPVKFWPSDDDTLTAGLPPRKAHDGDAGYDLHSDVEVTIYPGQHIKFNTGWCVAMPGGCVGLVTPRSGLADLYGLTVLNAPGIVDSGYRGPVKVILQNHGKEPLKIRKGDRIAQLVVVTVHPGETEYLDGPPDETDRGTNGFGSTGR